MGKYLDQCADDAWEVISGRKKIVGNKIIDSEIKINREDYGWLAPNGEFFPVEFGNHQAWASKYLLDEYRNGNLDTLK